MPETEEYKRFRDVDNARLLSADKDSASAPPGDGPARTNQDGLQILYARVAAETRDKQQRNVSDAARKVASANDATGHRDGFANENPSEALVGNRSLERGKTVTSTDTGARSDADARNTGIVAERIRGKRDNNPYRREPKDKHRQARHRPARRDVEEEANRSRVAAGKRTRGGDEEGATVAAKKAVERGNPDRSSYRYPRGKKAGKGETPSLDNSRSDRSGKMELSRKPAKNPGPERLGRRENQEPVTRREKRRARRGKDEDEERTVSLSENKRTRAGSKTTMNPPDNPARNRSVVNKEERLSERGEKRKGASRERHQSEKKWRIVNSTCVKSVESTSVREKVRWICDLRRREEGGGRLRIKSASDVKRASLLLVHLVYRLSFIVYR